MRGRAGSSCDPGVDVLCTRRPQARVAAAIDEGVPAPVIANALFDRFTSQHQADFGNKLLSAMRKQFGGHDEKPIT
jgi:6-phosphogluconate dehydrogenase (decarboxylating)